MFIERVCYIFIGGDGVIVEFHGTVGVDGVGELIDERFYCLPVCVLVMFVIPRSVDVVFP